MSLSARLQMGKADNRSSAAARLPAGFEDLARFADKWSVADEVDRMTARDQMPIADLREFYTTMHGRMPDVMTYLKGFKPGDMQPETAALYRLGLSFMDVGFMLERVSRTDRAAVYPLTRMAFEDVGAF